MRVKIKLQINLFVAQKCSFSFNPGFVYSVCLHMLVYECKCVCVCVSIYISICIYTDRVLLYQYSLTF